MMAPIVGFAVILRCGHVLACSSIPMTRRMVGGRPFMGCPFCEGDSDD